MIEILENQLLFYDPFLIIKIRKECLSMIIGVNAS